MLNEYIVNAYLPGPLRTHRLTNKTEFVICCKKEDSTSWGAESGLT